MIQACGVTQKNTAFGRAQLPCGRYDGISAPLSCSSESCPLPGWCVVTWDISARNPTEGLPRTLCLASFCQALAKQGKMTLPALHSVAR